MKKILSLLLAALMMLSVMPVTAFADDASSEQLTFTLKCDIDETLDPGFSSGASDYKAYNGSKVTKTGIVIPLNSEGLVNFFAQLDRMDGRRHDPPLRGFRVTIGDSSIEVLDNAVGLNDYYNLDEFVTANDGTKVDKSYVSGIMLAEFYLNFKTTKNVVVEYIYDPSFVAVTGVEMEKSALELPAGSSEQLSAKALPENATHGDVVWASSSPEVATVENGNITGISAGTATITATCAGRFTATCTVTVTENLDEKAAKAVEELINAIDSVTKDSGDTIKAAREAYDALTPEQKELVSEEAYAALVKAEQVYSMIVDSNKPDASDKGSKTNENVIKISDTAAAKGEENPSTGAPAMSIAPAVLVLTAAALALKKRG